MKSLALVGLILASLANCRESGRQEVPVQAREESAKIPGPVPPCSELAVHRVGAVEIQPVPLRDAIRQLQDALDSANVRAMVIISTEYHDFDGLVSLKHSDATLGNLADELSRQIGGSWDLDSGKGCFLVFRHPDDTGGTNFSSDPTDYLGPNEFVLPD